MAKKTFRIDDELARQIDEHRISKGGESSVTAAIENLLTGALEGAKDLRPPERKDELTGRPDPSLCAHPTWSYLPKALREDGTTGVLYVCAVCLLERVPFESPALDPV